MDYLDIFKKPLYVNDRSYLCYAIFNEKNAFLWFFFNRKKIINFDFFKRNFKNNSNKVKDNNRTIQLNSINISIEIDLNNKLLVFENIEKKNNIKQNNQ